MKTTFTKSNLKSVEIENIKSWDFPDFVDAFVGYAEHNGQPLSQSDLDAVNEDSCLKYELILGAIY